jgi:hypothetical protein
VFFHDLTSGFMSRSFYWNVLPSFKKFDKFSVISTSNSSSSLLVLPSLLNWFKVSWLRKYLLQTVATNCLHNFNLSQFGNVTISEISSISTIASLMQLFGHVFFHTAFIVEFFTWSQENFIFLLSVDKILYCFQKSQIDTLSGPYYIVIFFRKSTIYSKKIYKPHSRRGYCTRK